MFRGFDKVTGEFTTIYNSMEKGTIKRLSEIEQEDANRCASCGGEDCICCEYWHDRQRWVSADELFGDPFYDDENRGYEAYLNNIIEDCPVDNVPKEQCDECDARHWCEWRKES